MTTLETWSDGYMINVSLEIAVETVVADDDSYEVTTLYEKVTPDAACTEASSTNTGSLGIDINGVCFGIDPATNGAYCLWYQLGS